MVFYRIKQKYFKYEKKSEIKSNIVLLLKNPKIFIHVLILYL